MKNLFLFVLVVLILAAATGCAEGLGDGPAQMAPAPSHPTQKCFSSSPIGWKEELAYNPATRTWQGTGRYYPIATVRLQAISQDRIITLQQQGEQFIANGLNPLEFQVSDYKKGETITVVISKKGCTWQ